MPPVDTKELDVIMVAHNAGNLLIAAVRSAVQQAGSDAVWIMDAESVDGSVDALRVEKTGVHIQAVSNAGFSASNNRGIEATVDRFVLLLNPDALLEPCALDALLASARANPSAGVIGAAVYNSDGSAQANSFGRFPTLARVIVLRLERFGQQVLGNRRHSPTLPVATTPVDWVTGAAMLVRREAIADAGAMDEEFFLYYEDIEWCHRMRDHGWDVLLEPAAKVVHHLGGCGAREGVVATSYRASFYRYCDLYGLWGLKALTRAGVFVRGIFGGRR